ncbi:MAG: PKD domain-containing protein [Thioploca sp.]|nr:PKD domain-containing protein [Thioploca sp.]
MIKLDWLKVIILFGWLLSPVSFALQLIDGENFLYDIGQNGVLLKGSLDAYAGMYQLRVNGTNYVGQVTGLSVDGREVYYGTFTEPGSGLEIERRVYVSKTQNFARFSEILRNPSDSSLNTTVEIFGKLGSGSHTVTVADQGHFLMTNDTAGSKPVLLHYHSQVNNPIAATHALIGNQLSWIYSVTVPAQAQVRLIYFVAQTQDVAAAHRIATFIYGNPTALYENIDAAAREQLINFKPPKPIPRDEGESIPMPFLNLDELRTGALAETDPWSHQRSATLADTYAVNLESGETVTIRMAANFNAYLYLFQDKAGEELLAANDDSAVNTTNAEIIFTADHKATYYLEATAHNQREYGRYSLALLKGAINQPPQAHALEFELSQLTAPATVTFTDFSLDPDGEIAERCWQFGDGSSLLCNTEPNITHAYEQAGRYSVGLTVRDNEGAYAYHNELVAISWTPPGPGVVLPVGNTISGELAAADSRSRTRSSAFADQYRITAVTAGQELIVTMSSEQFEGSLYLYDEYYQRLHRNDNRNGNHQVELRYTPTNDGDLLLEATAFKDNTLGKYDLTLALVSPTTLPQLLIESSPALDNPLQNLFIARLPESFQATLFRWQFGDNSSGVSTDQAIVSHRYSREGNMTVTVTAVNADNQSVQSSKTFMLNKQSVTPQALFRVTPLFGQKPLRVFFNNESTFNSLLAQEPLRYLWDFGDGEVATDANPAHTFQLGGTYHVILQAFSDQQPAAYSVPITVIDRHSIDIPITGIVRERPQVLLAGFDPMLVDVLDTEVKIFAIVRPGKTPLQTVRFLQNGSDFQMIMQQIATYANGDQHYETVLTFQPGSFPVLTLSNLLGDQAGQYRIQAIDQAGQFHTFPNVEFGNNPPLAIVSQSLNIEPLHQVGVRRLQPQVLAAGFDPSLLYLNDTLPSLNYVGDNQVTIKAIVREGLSPLQSVTFQTNQGDWQLPMHLQEILPNGDKLYVLNYTYPYDQFEKGTLSNLFGEQPNQFTVVVIDQALQTHRFPQVKIGNFSR